MATDRIVHLFPRHKGIQTFRAAAHRHKLADEKSKEELYQKQLHAIQSLKGDPTVGKALFNSCLACHQVGDQGYHIAPALDGSANRDLKHLLTAIVKPNEAVESAYRTFRVVTHNGEIFDGFLYETGIKGTTIRFMGNAEKFIPRNHIKSQGFVHGQSFMPDTFGNLPEQSLADLVSFIKTIE